MNQGLNYPCLILIEDNPGILTSDSIEETDSLSSASDCRWNTTGVLVQNTVGAKPRNPSTPPVGAKRKQNPNLEREGVHELVPLGLDSKWIAFHTIRGRPGKRLKKQPRLSDRVFFQLSDCVLSDLAPVLDTDSISACSDIGASIQSHRLGPSVCINLDTDLKAPAPGTNTPPIKELCFTCNPLECELISEHQPEDPLDLDDRTPARDPLEYFDYYRTYPGWWQSPYWCIRAGSHSCIGHWCCYPICGSLLA